jgi:hypothetical protein
MDKKQKRVYLFDIHASVVSVFVFYNPFFLFIWSIC